MRPCLVLLSLAVFAGCAKAPVEIAAPSPAPTPAATPVPMARPLAPSQLAPEDESYALYLEKHLENLAKGDDERLLLDYVRYLHYGDNRYAKDYIKNVMAAVDERDGPVGDISIFETAYTLCYFENDRCAKTLGDLTRKYLVPKLRAGDQTALELIVIQKAAAAADDIEDDAVNEALSDPGVVKHAAEIRRLRKRYREFLSKF